MQAKKKRALIVAGGAAAALAVAVVVVILIFDINSYRPRIEMAASAATGMDVRIKGRMGLSFFPFGISARDIHVANEGSEILFIEDLKLGAELMPLLKKQLKVTRCELVRPVVTIVKEADGKYNYEGREKKPAERHPGAAFSLKELRLSRGVFVYLDRKSGETTEFKEINLDITDLLVADSGAMIKHSSFSGSLVCGEFRKKDLRMANIKSPVTAGKGVIRLTSLTMDIFGAKAEGAAEADLSAAGAVYTIKMKASKLDFEKLQESFGANKVIGGKGELQASLTLREQGGRNLMSGLEGVFSLGGDNLVTNTMDLDKVLSSYESSQKFNLIDLGAFFIAGPFSTVAVKGYRYGDVYNQTRGGRGTITRFISHWKIRDGVAEAADCAFATSHHRVALKGRLDLVSERYDNVIVALLDDKGCAKLTQGIRGPFGSPEIGAVSAVGSFAEPIFNLLRKAKRLIQGGRCEVFYNGAVPQPR